MKLRWKIYCFIIIFQTVGFPFSLLILKTPSSIVELISWIFIVIGASGLYLYVFKKNIGQGLFWRYFLFLFVIWDIFHLLIWEPFLMGVAYPPAAWFYTIALFGFLIPQYIALHRLSKQTIGRLPT